MSVHSSPSPKSRAANMALLPQHQRHPPHSMGALYLSQKHFQVIPLPHKASQTPRLVEAGTGNCSRPVDPACPLPKNPKRSPQLVLQGQEFKTQCVYCSKRGLFSGLSVVFSVSEPRFEVHTRTLPGRCGLHLQLCDFGQVFNLSGRQFSNQKNVANGSSET